MQAIYASYLMERASFIEPSATAKNVLSYRVQAHPKAQVLQANQRWHEPRSAGTTTTAVTTSTAARC